MKRFSRIILTVLAVAMSILPLTACSGTDVDELVVRDRDWAVGTPLPQASDFVVDMPDDVTAEFADEYSFDRIGTYELKIVLTRGISTSRHTVKMNLRLDTTPPKILGVKDIGVHIGDGVAYKNGITVTDDCGGELTLEVDSSDVDLNRAGEYIVRYVATDASGNRATEKAKVYVSKVNVTEEMLYAKLDPVIAQITNPDMTKEAKCRAVYQYVFNHIKYTSDSVKGDWVSAAYYSLDKGLGDCYNYFALSKAFFERMGIENMSIQRTPSASQAMGETHYWNYVNIGSASEPQWYHFDTTHLSDGQYNGKIVLVTEEQLQHYNRQIRKDNGNFYSYDKAGYPASATAKITRLPYEG